MKKIIACIILSIACCQLSFSQSTRVIGPAEKKLADSICATLSRHDITKITSKDEAVKIYTEAIGEHADLLSEMADELKVDMTDMAVMRKLGINIAMDLMKNQCPSFGKISTLMANVKTADQSEGSVSIGTLKRIDNKGFNYLVINEAGSETSFLWLRQFPGSEKFMSGLGANLGKKVSVSWKEVEVYVPAAKGYYKVKEITDVSFL